MKHINPTEQDVPTLIQEITSQIRSRVLLARYQDSIFGIEQAKRLYIYQMTTQMEEIDSIKHQFFGKCLPASENELKKLYKDHFVKSRYYGEIIQNTEWCPYCEVRPVKTLDHFLPQRYAALTIVSQNLIPACRDCNTEKTSQGRINFPSLL